VNPDKILRYAFCLIALYRTDEMPFNRSIGKGRHFCQRFLQIILAKNSLPGEPGFPHSLGWVSFTRYQQCDLVRLSVDGLRNSGNAGFDSLQV
jgi:hypothetical protein